MMRTEMHKDASIEAHFAVIEHFKQHTGKKVTALDAACALAVALGDAMGLAAMCGAAPAQLDALNEVLNDHYKMMIWHSKSCRVRYWPYLDGQSHWPCDYRHRRWCLSYL